MKKFVNCCSRADTRRQRSRRCCRCMRWCYKKRETVLQFQHIISQRFLNLQMKFKGKTPEDLAPGVPPQPGSGYLVPVNCSYSDKVWLCSSKIWFQLKRRKLIKGKRVERSNKSTVASISIPRKVWTNARNLDLLISQISGNILRRIARKEKLQLLWRMLVVPLRALVADW